MAVLRRNSTALTVCWALAFLLAPHSSGAQDLAGSAELQSYRELRDALLAQGWKPDTGYGLKDKSGRALYRFPEVLCGPQICNARWLAGKGREKIVKILRGYNGEEYRVLP
jgi:hypothetical protein